MQPYRSRTASYFFTQTQWPPHDPALPSPDSRVHQQGMSHRSPTSSCADSGNASPANATEKRVWDGGNPIIGGDTRSDGSTPPARAASYCSGTYGPQLVNCTLGVAIEAKDVSICTTLADHEALNTCITTWCAAIRNYTSCYGIANKDDQLMCLSRCNPNRNQ